MVDEDGPAERVEALSTGRARRATAGSRMRELIEQERERTEAIGGNGDDDDDDDDEHIEAGPSRETAVKRKISGKKRASGKGEAAKDDEDENAIFRNEVNDIDFEAREDAEDIVDSDFDLSSDQGDEDEDEGERELQAAEKAEKRATRAKAVPAHMRRPVAPSKPAEQRPAKRASFAADRSDAADGTASQQQRSSKRKATIQFAQSVQARAQADEERKARQSEAAAPKRKKVRLSQADYISEALEMEERNRESLKRFLEREEERRERDKRHGPKHIVGPFLRWSSITFDRQGARRSRMVTEIEDAGKGDGKERTLTLDPVFAAREAALKERQARQEKDQAIILSSRIEEGDQAIASSSHVEGKDQATTSLSHIEEMDVDDGSAKESEAATHPPAANGDLTVPSIDVVESNKELSANAAPIEAKDSSPAPPVESLPAHVGTAQPARPTTKVEKTSLPDGMPSQDALPPSEWEARAYVSLHGIPTSTPWPAIYGHLLGRHVDWSRYPIVPARNRPLRPRQSVCPVTGLPARYRDPRSGIAYANDEAYAILTGLIDGAFRWTGQGAVDVDTATHYDPLQMGCYVDRIDERGANDVLLLAGAAGTTPITATTTQASAAKSTFGLDKARQPTVRTGPRVEYVLGNALAPGDEQAVVAAALALPAGTTRSGGRRSGAQSSS